MMLYTLNIAIDDAGLQQIKDLGQYVTIVKSIVSQPLPSGNLPVAWVAWKPWENNTVTWQEIYSMYASTSVLQAGATISMSSHTPTPVQLGYMNTFQSGYFTSAQGGGASTFNLTNSGGGSYNFGLSQVAVVNNVSVNAPLNAVPVGNAELATFTPQVTVSIFLQSYNNNGVVISQVASNALVVTLTSQLPSANIGFNDSNNTFIQLSQNAPAMASQFDSSRRLKVVSA
jgi:hypothetical protein